MNKSNIINEIITKIQQEITDTAPIAVVGMPYGRTWVLEEVANRIGEEEPLLCSAEKGYENISPWGAKAAIRGLYGPFPELERVTLGVVTKFIDDINRACPSLLERKALSSKMSELV